MTNRPLRFSPRELKLLEVLYQENLDAIRKALPDLDQATQEEEAGFAALDQLQDELWHDTITASSVETHP